MRRTGKIKTLSLVAFALSILGLTIAYAALSSTLKVNGTFGLNSGKFLVVLQGANSMNTFNSYYSNKLSTQTFIYETNMEEFKTNSVSLNTPNDMSEIDNYSVTLRKPGDYQTLMFYVVNYSDVDVSLTSLNDINPVCTSNTGNTKDEQLVCDNLVIQRKWFSSVSAAVNVNLPDAQRFSGDIQVGDKIFAAGHYKNDSTWTDEYKDNRSFKVAAYKIGLKESMDELPNSVVTVSNININMTFTQSK